MALSSTFSSYLDAISLLSALLVIRYLIGESYMDLTKDEVDQFLEKEEKKITENVDDINRKMAEIKKTMAELKVKLYGKFGNSINLEEE